MQSVTRFALFDDTHGQPNWSQTGFPSRELDADCSGLADVLRGMGYDCAGVRPRLLSDRLSHPCLLVVPPPTGYYNPARQTWQPLTSSLFTPAEVRDILRFIDGGGRLLARSSRTSSAGCSMTKVVNWKRWRWGASRNLQRCTHSWTSNGGTWVKSNRPGEARRRWPSWNGCSGRPVCSRPSPTPSGCPDPTEGVIG